MPRLAALVMVVAGCGRGDGEDPSPTVLPDEDGPAAACAAGTYDTSPEAWALPAGVGAPRAEHDGDCAAGLRATRLLDLTGDGRPDLVALTDCEDADVGRIRWRVWPGEDGGFGAEIAWTLPGGHGAGAFGVEERADAACAPELDGDTGDGDTGDGDTGDGDTGDAAGDGDADDGDADDGDADDGDADDDLPAFLLADLDGDGRIDVAVTERCDDPTLAAGAWRVHRNDGAGFDPEGEVWTLPDGYTPGVFVAPRDTLECTMWVDAPAWALEDLDGDGAADLVVTASCDGPLLGLTEWEVRRGGPDGFGDPTAWPIPEAVRAAALESADDACPSSPAHFVEDLDGDGRADLVVPRACGATGSDWTVYPNEGEGHAVTAEHRSGPFALNTALGAAEAPADCDAAVPAVTVADDDGDGWADLTVTDDCASEVGRTRWDRWRGGPAGWVEQVPLALPAAYTPGAFRGASGEPGCGGTANRPAWRRVDLDGDGVVEIVVTEACDDAAVGAGHWRVHRFACAE